MADIKRFAITIDDETLARLDLVKKEKFYDKSFAEMYRYLIQEGLKEVEKREAK